MAGRAKRYLALTVEGPMRHHGFLGAFSTLNEARRVANENRLHTGKNNRVLDTTTNTYVEGEGDTLRDSRGRRRTRRRRTRR